MKRKARLSMATILPALALTVFAFDRPVSASDECGADQRVNESLCVAKNACVTTACPAPANRQKCLGQDEFSYCGCLPDAG